MWDCIFAPIPNVFHSPYQIAPLDFQTNQFIRSRFEKFISPRLDALCKMAASELLAELAECYKKNYRRQSMPVQWIHPLNTLQLVAAGIGGVGVAAICRAFSTTYRHLRSGLPDLLVVRVKDANGNLVNLSTLLGEDWKTIGWGEWQPNPKKKKTPQKNQKKKTNKEEKEEGSNDNDVDVDVGEGIEAKGEKEEKEEEKEEEEEEEATAIGGDKSDKSQRDKSPYDRYAYTGPELLPNEDYKYECILVEVKGPTDHLSEKQIVWLNVFRQNNVAALVVRVRETDCSADINDGEKEVSAKKTPKGKAKGTSNKSAKKSKKDSPSASALDSSSVEIVDLS